MLEYLDDSMFGQSTGSHELVQLRGQHRKTVQVSSVGDFKAAPNGTIVSCDVLLCQNLQHWLACLLISEDSLKWDFAINYQGWDLFSSFSTSMEPSDSVLKDIITVLVRLKR